MTSSILGYVIGVIIGGQIAQAFGWRAAFLALGLPGIGLALLAHFVLKEPRALPQFAIARSSAEPFREAVRAMLGKRAFVDLLVAMVLYFMMIYGAFVFLVPFLMRAYDLSVGQASAIFGGVSALTGIAGSVGGGILADRLARGDVAWLARLPGLAAILAWPLYLIALYSSSLPVTVVFLALGGVLALAALPPMFASVHHVCGSKRRATSIAVIFFFGNFFGIGLGPLLTGYMSDVFAKSVGAADGLRYALMIMMFVFLLAGWFMLRASRNMARDHED
jgi:predicted MFS family arabinose efflux permease